MCEKPCIYPWMNEKVVICYNVHMRQDSQVTVHIEQSTIPYGSLNIAAYPKSWITGIPKETLSKDTKESTGLRDHRI